MDIWESSKEDSRIISFTDRAEAGDFAAAISEGPFLKYAYLMTASLRSRPLRRPLRITLPVIQLEEAGQSLTNEVDYREQALSSGIINRELGIDPESIARIKGLNDTVGQHLGKLTVTPEHELSESF